MNGILNVDKPAGPTSHDCVARLRRALRIKRIGHAGTLDPMATGVLLLCIGQATRLSDLLMGGAKRYRAEITFGSSTDTQDSTGRTVHDADASGLTRAALESLLPRFTGDLLQIPPMVSSVHHEGRRLYELAREGVEVERTPRPIHVYDLRLLNFVPGERPRAEVDVRCSAGVYVRTLAHDLGEATGCLAHMSALRRLAVGPFRVEEALPLADAEEQARSGMLALHPMVEALGDRPLHILAPEQMEALRNGRALPAPEGWPESWTDVDLVGLAGPSGDLAALARAREGWLHPFKVFADPISAVKKPHGSIEPAPERQPAHEDLPRQDPLLTPILYDDLPEAPLTGAGRVLGIGVYDGVHLGHQAMIRRVLEEARRHDARSMLLTFDRLPEEILRPNAAPGRLMSLQEKIDALSALGPDEILVAHVKPELLSQEPAEFANVTLCGRLRPRCIVVGQDWRYGKGRKGTAYTLETDASGCGFEVIILPPVQIGEEIVSSTRIRSLIAEGSVEAAAGLLTRPYRVLGRVVAGKRHGRMLGFPTANLDIAPARLIPANGIYACRALGDDFARDAAVNIGVRPTLEVEGRVMVEAHLLDFESDLYGQDLRLEFVARLREERRFPSLDALKAQLAADVAAVRRLLGPG